MRKEILFLLLLIFSPLSFSAKKAFVAEGKSEDLFSYEEVSLTAPFYGEQMWTLPQVEIVAEESEHIFPPFPDPTTEPWHPLPTPPLPFSEELYSAHLSL